jgi:hypothetical protein
MLFWRPEGLLMTISEMLLPEFDQEMASTRAILECVPEDKFGWKPHEKSMTMGRLASHVAEMPQWAAFTINHEKLELTPETKPFMATSKSELMDSFAANTSEARAAISGASDEELGKVWSLVYGDRPFSPCPGQPSSGRWS